MTSAPEHQQIDRSTTEFNKSLIGAACFADTVACGGLGYGIYLGLKVTACPAACKVFCDTACSSQMLWNNYCCTALCSSLMCSGISLGMFVAGGAAGIGAIGCCWCTKEICSNSDEDGSDNCESHSIEVEDDTAPASTMTLIASAPGTGAQGNECVVVMSQPTAKHSEMNDGSDSFRSSVRPEPGRNPDTALTDNHPTFLPEGAPPSYEDSVGPPPPYESIQYA